MMKSEIAARTESVDQRNDQTATRPGNGQDYSNLPEAFEYCCRRFSERPAFSNLGHTLTYQQLARRAQYFAAYLQQSGLKPGDRLAIQLPNLMQYPVVLFGALQAGLVVVNTNPQYTPAEMRFQFNDAGVKAIVVLTHMASKVAEVLPDTQIEQVILTAVADFHPLPKRCLIHAWLKWVKRAVPDYRLPQAVSLNHALKSGQQTIFQPVPLASDSIAVLQYTGGTTGTPKAAVLTHGNLLANMLQVKEVLATVTEDGREVAVAPLPLYHIYSFTVNCMLMVEIGAHVVLIPNPRDIPALVKEMKRWRFTIFSGLNTLFVALTKSAEFRQLDFSQLKLTISGGMALSSSTAESWRRLTGCDIVEGYGLTETSPVVAVNPPLHNQLGTIGPALVETEVKVIDEQGLSLPAGEVGELCVRGPQVMREYWQQPTETALALSADGWLKTGDMAQIQADGYIRIVDRKKDMAVVSGFKVYPSEVEAVLANHPFIEECAVIGVPDEEHGEAIKAFVVSLSPDLKAAEIQQYARQYLTAYKVPRQIEFRDSLPKSNVGKVLRRLLKDRQPSAQPSLQSGEPAIR